MFIEDGASEVEEPGLGGVIITLVDPVAFDGKPGLSGLVAEGLATPPTGLGRDEGFMFTLSEEAADSGVEAIDVLLVVNQLNRQSSNGQGNDKEIELLGWNWGQSSAGAGFDSVVALENGTSIQAKGAQSPAIGILSSRSGVIETLFQA